MKIAYILGEFPVISETFIGEEIRELERLGHEITIIALHKPDEFYQTRDKNLAERTYYFSEIGKDKAKSYIRKYFSKIFRILPILLQQKNEPKYPFLIHSIDLAEYIKSKGCEHIHAHFGWAAASYAIGAAKLLKLPISFTCHGSDVFVKHQDLKLKIENADRIVAISDSIQNSIKEIGRNPRCKKIACGVDTDFYKPQKNLTKKNDKWVFIGRLVDCKGINELISGWSEIDEELRPELDVIGNGVLKSKLENLVKATGLEKYINFLGFKDSEWIANNAKNYKALILPLKKGDDGSMDTGSLVLKEAMAMGLVVVTTKHPDILKITNNNAFYLSDVSPKNIAEKVMEINSLKENELSKHSELSRNHIRKNYDLKKQVIQLQNLFRELFREL